MSITIENVKEAAQKTTPLSTAVRKLRAGRDTYAPVIIDHLNPALAISFGLTVAEVDALLAASNRDA